YALETRPSERLSENVAFRGSYVCFCDIPLGDLDLHMRKYSRFGIAFRKEFLLKKGATPVMYVPGHGRPALLPFHPYGRGIVRSNSVAFDEFWRRYQRLRARMEETARPGGSGDPARSCRSCKIVRNRRYCSSCDGNPRPTKCVKSGETYRCEDITTTIQSLTPCFRRVDPRRRRPPRFIPDRG